MPDKHIHLITKPVDAMASKTSAEMMNLGEQTKSEPTADDDNLVTLCCPDKRRTESSTRYWNGVKQYKSRMRNVPVKRMFSPIACGMKTDAKLVMDTNSSGRVSS
jgi:hypothetical protein